MIREVILVEVVTKSDMSTDKSKTFTNTEKAEKYFADCVREIMPNIEQDEIDNSLDDGFWDCKISYPFFPLREDEKSVIIKEISFEED
jgi:hypothetical protein